MSLWSMWHQESSLLGLEDSEWPHSHVWCLSKDGWDRSGLAGPPSPYIVSPKDHYTFFSVVAGIRRVKKWELPLNCLGLQSTSCYTAFGRSKQVTGLPKLTRGETNSASWWGEQQSPISEGHEGWRDFCGNQDFFGNNLLRFSLKEQFTPLLHASFTQLVPYKSHLHPVSASKSSISSSISGPDTDKVQKSQVGDLGIRRQALLSQVHSAYSGRTDTGESQQTVQRRGPLEGPSQSLVHSISSQAYMASFPDRRGGIHLQAGTQWRCLGTAPWFTGLCGSWSRPLGPYLCLFHKKQCLFATK